MRLQLKQVRESGEGKIFDIGDKLTIGRHSDNDIVIRFENVSRFHCLIYPNEEGLMVVKDLDSANGTFVNNARIDRVQVHRDDTLRVGPAEFVFASANDSETFQGDSPVPPTLQGILRHSYFQPKIAGIHLKALHDDAARDNAPPYFWPVNSIKTIGRMQFSDVWIDDASISRQHALIEVRERRVLLSDSSSTNGTFVNGERILQRALRDGDTFHVGANFRFRVTFEMNTETVLSTLATQGGAYAVELADERDKLFELFTQEYGRQTCLEVERQTSLVCDGFDPMWNAAGSTQERRAAFTKLLRLFVKTARVIPWEEADDHFSEQADMTAIEQSLRQDIHHLLSAFSGTGKTVYFEGYADESSREPLLNGVLVRLYEPLEAVIFHLAPETVAYFLYLSGYFRKLIATADL